MNAPNDTKALPRATSLGVKMDWAATWRSLYAQSNRSANQSKKSTSFASTAVKVHIRQETLCYGRQGACGKHEG